MESEEKKRVYEFSYKFLQPQVQNNYLVFYVMNRISLHHIDRRVNLS